MKTFKHKQTGEIATYKDGILKSSGFCVEIGVEPSNQFWEEIIEKKWEIVELIDIHTNIKFVPHTQEIYPNCNIYSIKRLSDGEIFTIGDPIIGGYKISHIKLGILNQVYIDLSKNGFHNLIKLEISQISKGKQSLFVSEDGVEIYEGGVIWYVTPEFKLFSCTASQSTSPFSDLSGNNKNKNFSNKKSAEHYVLYNKPCLSITEILHAIGKEYSVSTLGQLETYVKSKIL
jgi:hypothetical protein